MSAFKHIGFVLFVGLTILFLDPRQAGAQQPTNGLIGFWSGNNTAADSSPTGNNGSFSGQYVPGRPGGGAAFDLSTGTVTIPNSSVYDDFATYPGWTVGFWFHTNGIVPNSLNDLFLGQDDGSGYQPKWFIDYGYTVFGPNTNFVWHVNDYNTERIFLTSQSVNPLPSGWNQLTVVVDNDGGSVTFYLNGQQIGSDSLPSYVLETTAPLIFGQAEGLTYGGLLNDIAIYNRALSPQEVTELVNSTRSNSPVSAAPVIFAQTAIGAASASQNALLAINDAITISAIGVPQSQGGVQEFTVGAISGCAIDGVTTISPGSICTVPVTFSPGYPGLRQMPLVVQSSAGTVQFTLQGIGDGPMVAFGPGTIATVAGNGVAGYNGDNMPATGAELDNPSGLMLDDAGNLYIADTDDNRIRVVAPDGTITTVAGSGMAGYTGDNVQATSAELSDPAAIAVDGAGNIYIADASNDRVRMVMPNGKIATVAGIGTPGYNGDNIAATTAELSNPAGVAVDSSGNLYIADANNNRIRMVTPSGTINTVAGTGTAGYNGDNIAATTAELSNPAGVAVDSSGNLYIADANNNRIRMVAPGGTITTVAGNGTAGYNSDGIPATSAELDTPSGVAVDSSGNLYIADANNNRIRMVAPGGTITTVAGNGTAGYNGDSILATGAELDQPMGVAVDSAGNLYIADQNNDSIRKVDVSDPPSVTFASTEVGSTSVPQDVTVQNLGNAVLSISQISATSGFTLLGPDTSCSSSGQALNPAESCVLGIEFSPTASGMTKGEVDLSDNSLNVTGATQSVSLTGMSPLTASKLAISAPSTAAAGTPFSVTVTAEDSAGNTVASYSGTVMFTTSDAGTGVVLPANYTFQAADNGVHTFINGITLVSAGNQSIAATDTGNTTITGSATVAINQAVPMIVTPPTASPVIVGQTLAASTLIGGSANVTGVFTWTAPSTVVSTAGSSSYSVTFAPNDSVDYTTATTTVSVLAIQVTQTTANLSANQVTLQLTSSATATGFFTFLQGANAVCGSATQTAAGEDSTGTVVIHGSLPLTANVQAQYTVRNLMSSTAYTVCFTPDGASGPVSSGFTTAATAVYSPAVWANVGNADFAPGGTQDESLAFAPDGTAYLAFQDEANGYKATVMKFNGTAWINVGNADFSPGSASNESLAFAPNGTPYVAFSDSADGGNATVMQFNGTAWVDVGNADFSPGATAWESLAFAPDGTPYVAFQDDSRAANEYGLNGAEATVMEFSSGTWANVGSADFSPGAVVFNSLAFAPDGTPYLAFEDVPNNEMETVMAFNGTAWANVGSADFSAGTIRYTSLAFAPNGTPYVAYQDWPNGYGATVMEFNGTAWVDVGKAGFSPNEADWVSLAIAPDGVPYVAFEDWGNGTKASVMEFNGAAWIDVGNAGFSPGAAILESLAIAPDGTPYVAYQDFPNGNNATVTRLQAASQVTPILGFTPSPASQSYGTAIASGSLDASASYNNSNVTGTFVYTATVNGNTATLVAGATVLPAGNYTITATFTPSDTSAYASTSTAASYTVYPVALTITASSGSMTYGGAVPAVTASYAGFVNGDSASSLTTQPTCSTIAASHSPVGNYPSSCTGAVDADYSISYVGGSVSVVQAPLTITASGGSMIYGGTSPAITASYAGFVNGDSPASLAAQPACSTTATSHSEVGGYPSSCSGAVDTNYSISYVSGSVTISQATLNITATNTTTVFGTVPAVSPIYSAFAGGDSAANLTAPPTCMSTVSSSTAVGSYTGANTCSGAVDPNYSFTYVAGNATVTQASQTISFTPLSSPVIYGGSPVSLSATATSGLAVSFNVVSGPGTVNGNTLTPTGAGTILIAANQAGNADYAAAAQVTQSVAVNNSIPFVGSMMSAFADAGGAAFTITINGSGFLPDSTVYWSTSALTTQFVSTSKLTATVTAADIATPGAFAVSVENPAPGGGMSDVLTFEVDSATGTATAPTLPSATVTVTAGSTATYQVSFPPSVSSATAKCLNLPPGAACSYSETMSILSIMTSPTTPPGNYQVTAVFTESVTTTSAGSLVVPLLLLPLVLLRKRLKMPGIWAAAYLLLMVLATSAFGVGCGGSGMGSGQGTKTQTQTVTSSAVVGLTIQ